MLDRGLRSTDELKLNTRTNMDDGISSSTGITLEKCFLQLNGHTPLSGNFKGLMQRDILAPAFCTGMWLRLLICLVLNETGMDICLCVLFLIPMLTLSVSQDVCNVTLSLWRKAPQDVCNVIRKMSEFPFFARHFSQYFTIFLSFDLFPWF